jgi:hypothetical protein
MREIDQKEDSGYARNTVDDDLGLKGHALAGSQMRYRNSMVGARFCEHF